MWNKIFIFFLITSFCFISVIPLLKTQIVDYGTLVFVTYFRAFIWFFWGTIVLLAFLLIIFSDSLRRKFLKLYLICLAFIFIIVGGATLKVQLESQLLRKTTINPHESR